MALIECRALTRQYHRGTETITPLDHLDLEIEAGKFLALMGPSGSGKTTLLNLLAGIDRPTSGDLTVDGVDLGGLSRARLAAWRCHAVGYIFQLYNLQAGGRLARGGGAGTKSALVLVAVPSEQLDEVGCRHCEDADNDYP